MAGYYTYFVIILLIFYSGTVHPQQNQQQQNQQQQKPQQQNQQQQNPQQQNKPQQNQPQQNQQQQNKPQQIQPQQNQQAQQTQQNGPKPISCAKMDFNQLPNPDFAPSFLKKEYRPGTQPTPFRQPAHFYLSANVNENSLGYSKTKFSLNPNSMIETAVFFQAVGNAFFDIIVYDFASNLQETLRVSATKGWTVLKKNITKNMQNARIMLNVNNCTPQCVLAIQYLDILNSAIKTPECTPTPPPQPPTTKPPITTPKPTVPPRPTDPNQVWLWAITATCLGIVILIVILIAIYCIYERRKSSPDLESK